VHGYPKWFRFHSKANEKQKHHHHHGGKSSIGKNKNMNKNKNKELGKHSDGKTRTCPPMPQKTRTTEVDDDGRKARRNERRLERNKHIPCRFHHSNKGCRKGDLCTFLHDDPIMGANTENGHDGKRDVIDDCAAMDMEVDGEIDALTNRMERGVRISVPKNVSFGRRRR